MVWSQLVQDWSKWYAALQTAFPRLEGEAGYFLRQSQGNFIAYLADRHDLTILEAEEALQDFLFLAACQTDVEPISAVG